jgi:hypothetical protein
VQRAVGHRRGAGAVDEPAVVDDQGAGCVFHGVPQYFTGRGERNLTDSD